MLELKMIGRHKLFPCPYSDWLRNISPPYLQNFSPLSCSPVSSASKHWMLRTTVASGSYLWYLPVTIDNLTKISTRGRKLGWISAMPRGLAQSGSFLPVAKAVYLQEGIKIMIEITIAITADSIHQ